MIAVRVSCERRCTCEAVQMCHCWLGSAPCTSSSVCTSRRGMKARSCPPPRHAPQRHGAVCALPAARSGDELKFLEAAQAYNAGRPIMSDEEYDALKLRLRQSSSAITQQGPRCRWDGGGGWIFPFFENSKRGGGGGCVQDGCGCHAQCRASPFLASNAQQ